MKVKVIYAPYIHISGSRIVYTIHAPYTHTSGSMIRDTFIICTCIGVKGQEISIGTKDHRYMHQDLVQR